MVVSLWEELIEGGGGGGGAGEQPHLNVSFMQSSGCLNAPSARCWPTGVKSPASSLPPLS